MTNTHNTGFVATRPTRLDRLRPVELAPQRVAQRPAALAALQRVDVVEIRKRQDSSQKTFVVDVYNKFTRRRIPVVNSRRVCSRLLSSSVGSSDVDPDTKSERNFADIRRLRDAVYYCAGVDHGLAPCTYCSAIYDFILLSSSTPRTAMQYLQREQAQCESLTKFFQQLVELAVQVKTTPHNEPCHGQQEIPELVAAFLQLTPQADACAQI